MVPFELVYLNYLRSYQHRSRNSDSFWFTRYINIFEFRFFFDSLSRRSEDDNDDEDDEGYSNRNDFPRRRHGGRDTFGRRSLHDHESERLKLIRGAESYLGQLAFGSYFNGHQCMLRALCEAAAVSNNARGTADLRPGVATSTSSL